MEIEMSTRHHLLMICLILILGNNLNLAWAQVKAEYPSKNFSLEEKNPLNLSKTKGETKGEKKGEKIENDFSLGKYIFKTIGALVIIGFLIFLVIKLFNRFPGRMAMGMGDEKNLVSLLGSVPLSPNKYLQLVEVAQKVLLLGVTENNINILTEIKDQEQIDLIKANQSKLLSQSGFPFAFYLNKMVKKFKLPGSHSINLEDSVNFIDQQKKRLKELS